MIVNLIRALHVRVERIFWPHFAVTTMATSVKIKDAVLLTALDRSVIKTLARSNHANKGVKMESICMVN